MVPLHKSENGAFLQADAAPCRGLRSGPQWIPPTAAPQPSALARRTPGTGVHAKTSLPGGTEGLALPLLWVFRSHALTGGCVSRPASSGILGARPSEPQMPTAIVGNCICTTDHSPFLPLWGPVTSPLVRSMPSGRMKTDPPPRGWTGGHVDTASEVPQMPLGGSQLLRATQTESQALGWVGGRGFSLGLPGSWEHWSARPCVPFHNRALHR